MSEFKGTIIKIGEKQTFDSGFCKVEFVVKEDTDQYPQEIKFDIVKDKADSFLQCNNMGDKVSVSYNLRGNEYNDKHYVSLQAWKVESETPQEIRQNETFVADDDDDDDDLPF